MANGSEITISSEDKGTVIKGTAKSRTNGVETLIDLNDLTAILILLRDPDGNLTSYNATAVSGGADGIWSFTTATPIFSRNPGIWQIQAKYSFGGGTIFYSNLKTLNVGEALV